jgi:hypothetical protein
MRSRSRHIRLAVTLDFRRLNARKRQHLPLRMMLMIRQCPHHGWRA